MSGQLPPGVPDNTYQTLIERINQQGGKAVLDSHSEVLQLGMEAKPWLVRFNRHILEMSVQRRMDTVQDVTQKLQVYKARRNLLFVKAARYNTARSSVLKHTMRRVRHAHRA
ncbi:MAG: hypothetical protein WBO73_06690 [Gammaproteobacteria bacterium]